MTDAINATLDSVKPSTVPLWIGLALLGGGILWLNHRLGEAEDHLDLLGHAFADRTPPDPETPETEAEPVEPVKTEAKAKPRKGKAKPKDGEVVAWLPEHDAELAMRLAA